MEKIANAIAAIGMLCFWAVPGFFALVIVGQAIVTLAEVLK